MSLPVAAVALPGSPLGIAIAFVLTALFLALTAHVAARYVLGDVPYRLAAFVGVVPATVLLALVRYASPWVVLAAVAADFLAIQTVYRLRYRTAALVAVVHYTVTVLLGYVVVYAAAVYLGAPG